MKGTGRVEAFSDGFFAIAITLLVLDLKVPTQSPLLEGLLAQWPVYAAYLISCRATRGRSGPHALHDHAYRSRSSRTVVSDSTASWRWSLS